MLKYLRAKVGGNLDALIYRYLREERNVITFMYR